MPGRDRTAAGTADHVAGGLHGQLEHDGEQREVFENEDHRREIPHARTIHAHLRPPSEVSKHHEE